MLARAGRPSATGARWKPFAATIDAESGFALKNGKTFSYSAGLRHPGRLRAQDKNDTQQQRETINVPRKRAHGGKQIAGYD